MAQTHAKLSSRVDDPAYRVKKRNAGGKLHRRGEKTRAKAREEAVEAGWVSEAQVVKAVKSEQVLTARVTAALVRVNAKIAADAAALATRQLAQLNAIRYVPAPTDADIRASLIAQGIVS